jgi:FAD/FMN-containing dehydrogenase
LGENGVATNPVMLDVYGKDWTNAFPPKPACVLFPKSSQDIQEIVKYCVTNDLAIVPSGGRTGLAGGACATRGEVLVSLEKFNKILDIDTVGLSIEAEAGVTTQQLQEKAKDAGLFYPIDLGAKGSCQLGGNIATNAGGLKFIRFGGMREHVLGLEVVLGTGEILDLNLNLRKNNTGYDLKQLFIGAEGTLGIITKATVRLVSAPRGLTLCLLGLKDFSNVLKTLATCHQASVTISAFEFFTDRALEYVLDYGKGKNRQPLTERWPYYVLLELEQQRKNQSGQDQSDIEALLEKVFETQLVEDGVIATNSQEFADFWALRENITESVNGFGYVRKNDISLPIGKLSQFVDNLTDILKGTSDFDTVLFGHVGDGNLHVNFLNHQRLEQSDFLAAVRTVEGRVFETVRAMRGSVSAEHGIGLLKKQDLCYSRSFEEVFWMKAIKRQFDPHNVMNPGKIFDLELSI